jgi:YD repeat-containing protein
LALANLKTNRNSEPAQPAWLTAAVPTPQPTSTRADGVRRITPGPYVPPALRADNGERRANGKEGKLVDVPQMRQGAPLSNLPALAKSRKKRKTPASGTATVSSIKGSMETLDDLPEMPCADCNPGGGGGAGGTDPFFGTARMRPENETGDPGVTLGSRNFNWSTPLVSLPGRAGLDVGISLFYNSLVWTKQGSAIEFNADHGTPAPGFQIGLPRLQAEFFDSDDNTNAYLMVTPSGGRIEMKQVGTTNVYESADSTYTQLTFPNSVPVVKTTDGTQYVFGTQASAEWRCTRIEDRNGNFISATYDTSSGHLQTITDTLGRVLTFNYDSNNNLLSITQPWGNTTHTWASFDYTLVPMSFSFSNLSVVGATTNTNLTMLSFITFPDNSTYHFDYNSYGQVYRIRRHAPDDHELAHTLYTIDTSGAQTDCPRVTDRRDAAQDWNSSEDAVTTYAITNSATWTNPETSASETGTLVQQTAPDGTIYKEYSHASGWDAGLTLLSELWSGGVKKKWTSTNWTQDNTSLTFPDNPRVLAVNVYDDGGNRRRTTIVYGSSYNLPIEVREWQGTNADVLYRLTTTTYNLDAQYVTNRLIGLVDNTQVTDGNETLFSKTSYTYDLDLSGDLFVDTPAAATQHDRTNYGPSFIVGRGNLSKVERWDVYDPQNTTKVVATK